MDIFKKVAALSLDITAANTAACYGRRIGTCILLEQELGKDFVYLIPRHHDMEHMGASSEPEVSLFKGFKVQWKSIDTTSYELRIADKSVCLMILEETSHWVMQFDANHLQKKSPQDDYLETFGAYNFVCRRNST